jgi:predicted TIM-barrel fold metal-dependent hydrolase
VGNPLATTITAAHLATAGVLERFGGLKILLAHGAAACPPSAAGADRVVLGSDRPFDMGTDTPVDDIRALQLGAEEELMLSGNAGRLLGLAGG